MEKRDEQRQRLFDEGEARFRKLLPGATSKICKANPHLADGFYVCPLCLRAFRREALEAEVLSIEHVPPQNQGPPFTKILICTECNNRSGTELDVHLADRDRVERIGALGATAEHITADFAGVQINASIAHSEQLGSWTIVVDPELNNPASLQAMRSQLEGPGVTNFNVRSKVAYDRERWRLALLKVGYLIGFAQGGYSYAFRPNLQPIRDQIRRPTESIIDLDAAVVLIDPATVNPAISDVMDRWILTLRDRDGLAITLKSRMVLLPIVTEPKAFYAELAALPEPVKFDFRAIDTWPTWPSYRIDDMTIRAS